MNKIEISDDLAMSKGLENVDKLLPEYTKQGWSVLSHYFHPAIGKVYQLVKS